MAGSRKQVAFDPDTKALEKYYPTPSWNNAYDVIKRYMLRNGFSWLQGSVYVSDRPMSSTKVTRILKVLVKRSYKNLSQGAAIWIFVETFIDNLKKMWHTV